MSVSLVFTPRALLKKIRKWVACDDPVGVRLYQQVQDAEHMGAKHVIIQGDDALYLTSKFLN